MIDPDHHWEIELFHNARKIMSEYRFLISVSITLPYDEGQWKLQQPNPGKICNGPDPLGMKIWVISSNNQKKLKYLLRAKAIQMDSSRS